MIYSDVRMLIPDQNTNNPHTHTEKKPQKKNKLIVHQPGSKYHLLEAWVQVSSPSPQAQEAF